jgi:hypothetical protein
MGSREPAWPARFRVMPFGQIDQRACQQRHREGGQQPGREQRGRHRNGKRLEKGTGHAREKPERREHDQRRGGRPGEGREELGAGFEDANILWTTAAPRPPGNVLDHDDHIIDHEPDGRRQAAQRHDVKTHA